MKSEKGITLISLIIYVIAMLITVTIITVVTSYFYKNVDVTSEKYTYFSEFTRISSYLSEEANIPKNKILEISPESDHQVYMALSSGNQYTYIPANQAIYQNNIKIASGVEQCSFSEDLQNGKSIIKITVTIQGKTRNMKYILNNW